jgi:hypothetical protein
MNVITGARREVQGPGVGPGGGALDRINRMDRIIAHQPCLMTIPISTDFNPFPLVSTDINRFKPISTCFLKKLCEPHGPPWGRRDRQSPCLCVCKLSRTGTKGQSASLGYDATGQQGPAIYQERPVEQKQPITVNNNINACRHRLDSVKITLNECDH